jgi:hypothetical protein
MRTTRTDFEARTARGANITTFGDEDTAVAWLKDRGPEFPGCTVDHVITTIERFPVVLPKRRPLRLVAGKR